MSRRRCCMCGSRFDVDPVAHSRGYAPGIIRYPGPYVCLLCLSADERDRLSAAAIAGNCNPAQCPVLLKLSTSCPVSPRLSKLCPALQSFNFLSDLAYSTFVNILRTEEK